MFFFNGSQNFQFRLLYTLDFLGVKSLRLALFQSFVVEKVYVIVNSGQIAGTTMDPIHFVKKTKILGTQRVFTLNSYKYNKENFRV